MSESKLYRRLVVLEILSDYDPTDEDVVSAIQDGAAEAWSIATLADSASEVTPGQMRSLLETQGSDPEFLVPEGEDENTDALWEAVKEARVAIRASRDAAEGGSNDEEIRALQDAIESAEAVMALLSPRQP